MSSNGPVLYFARLSNVYWSKRDFDLFSRISIVVTHGRNMFGFDDDETVKCETDYIAQEIVKQNVCENDIETASASFVITNVQHYKYITRNTSKREVFAARIETRTRYWNVCRMRLLDVCSTSHSSELYDDNAFGGGRKFRTGLPRQVYDRFTERATFSLRRRQPENIIIRIPRIYM